VDNKVPWISVLRAGDAAAGLSIAREVASRLRDPRVTSAVAVEARDKSSLPHATHWRPHGIFQGYAGTALFIGTVDQCLPGEGWDLFAHQHLQLAVRAIEQLGRLTHSMSTGVSGLAFAAWHLSRQGERYRRLLRSLDTAVIELVTLSVTKLAQTLQHGVRVSDFDVISGFSGVGRYLLLRSREAAHRATLDRILRFLVILSEDENGLPHWYTPARYIADSTTLSIYPHGNLNCGLAHGIPGPLALLSLAAMHGVRVDGQIEAISRIAEWLIACRIQDQWGLNWPTSVPLSAEGFPAMSQDAAEKNPISPHRPSRAAWCYGSPGIARSLWFAGKALSDRTYQDLALAAMEAVYRRPIAARHIDSPTFCHGIAGLQQITLRFAHDSESAFFVDAACALHRQLVDEYDPASLLGYRNLEPGGRQVDQPGILDGAAGVGLVLLAASTPIEPRWDTLFLLS
jgi:lantibiotic modifying enzyme